MSTQIQRRRGTTAQHASFTGAIGETTIDTDKEVVVVHDGTQVGGYPLMRENASNSALALGSAATPSLKFTGDTNTGIYSPGADQVAISTNGTQRLTTDTAAVTSTLPIVHPLGAVGTPSITFTGDLNTGIYSPTADTLAFVEGGVEAMRIDSSGRVGVGTSVPQESLTVNGACNLVSTAFNSGGFILGTSTASYDWRIADTGSTDGYKLSIGSVTGGTTTPRVTIDTAGRVGIGTSSPTARLHVTDLTATAVELLRLQVNLNSPSGNKSITWADSTDVVGRISVDYTSPTAKMRFGSLYNSGYQTSDLMTLTPTGLGIGTTSPGATLHVEGSELRVKNGTGVPNVTLAGRDSDGTAILAFQNNGSSANNAALTATTNTLALATGGTERARIDSSGRLLVGTSTSRSNVYNTTGYDARFQLEGTDGGTTAIGVFRNSNDNAGSRTIYAKSRGTSIGSNTVVQSGDQLGSVSFQGSDGSEFVEGACIECFVDATPGANDMPGRLVFSTTADGAASPTERMRIGSDGSLMVGTTSAGGDRVRFASPGASTNQLGLVSTDDASNNPYVIFRNSALTAIGTITRVGTTNAVVYNTTSDYRLKTIVGSVTGQGARIDALKPIDFQWKEGGEQARGFLAHEFKEVYDNSVTGEKDAVDADGNPVYQAMQASTPEIIADLVAEIQSLRARVAALETA